MVIDYRRVCPWLSQGLSLGILFIIVLKVAKVILDVFKKVASECCEIV